MMFDSFVRYSQEMIDSATSSDISRLADELDNRVNELQEMTLDIPLPSSEPQFLPLDTVEMLTKKT